MAQEMHTEGGSHEGGCLCGAVRYRITAPFDSVVHCHCTMCRRASGAPVVTWVTVPTDRFAVTKGKPATYRSSEHGRRTFCASCGAQLVFTSTRRPGEVDVTLGTLDHPEHHAAEIHIFTAHKVPWLRLDEALPSYPGFSPGGD